MISSARGRLHDAPSMKEEGETGKGKEKSHESRERGEGRREKTKREERKAASKKGIMYTYFRLTRTKWNPTHESPSASMCIAPEARGCISIT